MPAKTTDSMPFLWGGPHAPNYVLRVYFSCGHSPQRPSFSGYINGSRVQDRIGQTGSGIQTQQSGLSLLTMARKSLDSLVYNGLFCN